MPHRAPIPTLTQAQHDELLRLLERFPAQIRERGIDYLARGFVSALTIRPPELHARVRGTRVYETAWEWDPENGWLDVCSCPMGGECKHSYAVGRAALQRTSVLGSSPRGAARRGRPARPAAAPRRARPIDRLRESERRWEREEALAELLGPDASGSGASPGWGRLTALLAEPDPDLRCLALARELLAGEARSAPPELRAYLDRTDVVERWEERERGKLTAALLHWALDRPAPPSKRLRVVLLLRDTPRGPCVVAEARLSAARLVDAPRSMSQLEALLAEAIRTPGLVADDELILLEWLVRERIGGRGASPDVSIESGALRRLLERAAGSRLVRWCEDLDPALAGRVGVVPGSSVHLADTPVRLGPALVSRPDGRALALRFVWPDGRSRGLAEALTVDAPRSGPGRAATSLVLCDGVFFPVVAEPPPFVRESFARARELPLRDAGDGALLRRLALRFPELREACSELVRHRRVTPCVLVDLHDDRWIGLRLIAHDGPPGWAGTEPLPPGALVFEHDGETGWLDPESMGAGLVPRARAGAPPAGDPAVLAIDEPAPDDVEPALAWIRSLPSVAGPGAPEASLRHGIANAPDPWILPLGAESLDALARALEDRPQPLPVLATAAVRKILEPAAAPRAKVSVRTSGVDFFEVSAEWEKEGEALSEGDLATLLAATTRFVRLRSGWVQRAVAAEQEQVVSALADLGIALDGRTTRIGVAQLAGAREASVSTLASLARDPAAARAARTLRERIASFSGVPAVPLPAGLTAELRPYQKAGVDRLAYASSLGLGSILADDMGLGKTIQALAWLLHLRAGEPAPGPSLVVAPTSVIHNWEREAARFAPGLRVLVLERGERRHSLRREIARHDLVVTNYALLRRDASLWAKERLFAAILDEAQSIKNPDAAVARAAHALHAKHRLALTGTPLENRALDLWSLSAFVNPGYLGPRRAFVARYDGADAPPHARRLLAAKLRPVLVRRLKREVAPELPDRIEERRDCELTPGQRKLYLAELRRSRELADDAPADGRRAAQRRIEVLAALTRLRQICCHPQLVAGRGELGSGKLDALFELLEPLLAEGHKVLVFSQFVRFLALVRAELDARGMRSHVLTGETTRRDDVVRAFQEDPDPAIFLVSLRAGGTGLNLTAASYVVLLDPWWNPAVEAQAIDRAHRIGQERTVIAYRLVTRGTVEEKILALQERKAGLADDVLGEEGLARSLSRDDLAYLFEEP